MVKRKSPGRHERILQSPALNGLAIPTGVTDINKFLLNVTVSRVPKSKKSGPSLQVRREGATSDVGSTNIRNLVQEQEPLRSHSR